MTAVTNTEHQPDLFESNAIAKILFDNRVTGTDKQIVAKKTDMLVAAFKDPAKLEQLEPLIEYMGALALQAAREIQAGNGSWDAGEWTEENKALERICDVLIAAGTIAGTLTEGQKAALQLAKDNTKKSYVEVLADAGKPEPVARRTQRPAANGPAPR